MYSLFRDSPVALGSLLLLLHLKSVCREELGWDQPSRPNIVSLSGIHLFLVDRLGAGATEGDCSGNWTSRTRDIGGEFGI